MIRVRPGQRLRADTVNSLIDGHRSNRIVAGPGIEIKRTAAGTVISARTEPARPVRTKAADPGVCLPLFEAWSDQIAYKTGECVTHQLEGETYPRAWRCTADTAGTDVPGASSKWTSITEVADEWDSGTAYQADAIVMWGKPWQYYKWTASEQTSAGEEPGVSPKWTRGAGVLFGITGFPPGMGEGESEEDILVPHYELVVSKTRYSTTTHKLTQFMRRNDYDATGRLVRTVPDAEILVFEAEECE